MGPAVPPGCWEQQVPLGLVPIMFFPVAEQAFVPLSPQVDKMSTAISVCTASTAGDLADFDFASEADGSDSSDSFRQDTGYESGDQWAVNVKNTFIDVRSPRG